MGATIPQNGAYISTGNKRMKSTYSITLQGTLPVIAKIQIQANSESEAAVLAERLGECERQGVKTTAFEIEAYPADFLRVEDIAEITAVGTPDVGKVWKRYEIETLLEQGSI